MAIQLAWKNNADFVTDFLLKGRKSVYPQFSVRIRWNTLVEHKCWITQCQCPFFLVPNFVEDVGYSSYSSLVWWFCHLWWLVIYHLQIVVNYCHGMQTGCMCFFIHIIHAAVWVCLRSKSGPLASSDCKAHANVLVKMVQGVLLFTLCGFLQTLVSATAKNVDTSFTSLHNK